MPPETLILTGMSAVIEPVKLKTKRAHPPDTLLVLTLAMDKVPAPVVGQPTMPYERANV